MVPLYCLDSFYVLVLMLPPKAYCHFGTPIIMKNYYFQPGNQNISLAYCHFGTPIIMKNYYFQPGNQNIMGMSNVDVY